MLKFAIIVALVVVVGFALRPLAWSSVGFPIRLPVVLERQSATATVLVLGVDRRGTEVPRTDTMLLARLGPPGEGPTILSIPRDLWVQIPGQGEDRINTAYFWGESGGSGGAALARKTVEENFGVRVDRVAVIDFVCFQSVVDAAGGVTIDVPRELTDEAYPTGDGGTTRVVFEPGRQTINGERALQYARTRAPDSDFGRIRRQQQVLTAVADRMRNPVAAAGVAQAAVARCPGAGTEVSLADLATFGGLGALSGTPRVQLLDESTVTPVTLPSGAQVLQPRWDRIRPVVGGIWRRARDRLHSDVTDTGPVLVECVPNVSEGRRPDVIAAIGRAAADVAGVHLLDVHSDVAHNRSVYTIVAEPEAMADAVLGLVCAATVHIDMKQHRGVHPRMGAVDVIPFTPLGPTPMQVCIDLAHSVGRRIASDAGIPVYFYGEAALHPERRRLVNVRRGEYEGLRALVTTDPTRQPDAGPAHLGSAGATAVGARLPLVAFNMHLRTADVSVARAIAAAVRASSGGLPGVQALGLITERPDIVQVSMNVTDLAATPLHVAVDAVRAEAERRGVGLAESELVGLMPLSATLDAAAAALGLPQLTPSQIIELALARTTARPS